MSAPKMRTALIVLDDADKTKIVVTERATDLRLSFKEGDSIEHGVRMSPEAARALAKHLTRIAHKITNRPEGTP